jgi:hypothetical protein
VVSFLAERDRGISGSDHGALEVQADLPWSLTLNVEGYYKHRRGLATAYKDPNLRIDYESGYAVGVDVLLRRETDPVSGWIAYSLSRSMKKGEYWYFAGADRTHSVKAFLQVRPFEDLRLDLYWTYATGVPYTDIVAKYTGLEEDDNLAPYRATTWRPVWGRKNAARAIDYKRLDVGVTWSLIWGELLVKPYLFIFNVTRAPNPYFVTLQTAGSNETSRFSEIVPTFGVTVEF